MTQTTPPRDHPTPADAKNILEIMIKTIADTTWRMFVPSVGGTVLGLIADNNLNTKPWLTITGVTVGSTLSIVLIYAQIKRLKNPKENETK